MSQITIEHNPSQERLEELGVAGWPIWEKEISTFPIDFDETETAYVLEGEIIVTPQAASRSYRARRSGGIPGRAGQPMGSGQAVTQTLSLRLTAGFIKLKRHPMDAFLLSYSSFTKRLA